jgi:hypothetical protein
MGSTSATKGYFRLTKVGDASKYLVLKVTAVSDAGSYRNFTVQVVGSSASSPFVASDQIFISFDPTGDAGEDGLDGAGAGDVQSDDAVTVIGKILGWSSTDKHVKGQSLAALIAGAGIASAEKVFGPWSGVALAGTTNISATDTMFVKITAGTGPITSFGTTRDGWLRLVRADVDFTITRNATNLETPNQADAFVVAGSFLLVARESSESTAKTRVLLIIPPDGRAYRGPNSIPENLSLDGILSPTQITANQNNYAPTGHQTALIERINSDAARTLTGLAAPTSGRAEARILINTGSFDITLSDADTSSSASNRFFLGANFAIKPNMSIMLWYDLSSSRWRPISQVFPIGALAYLDRITGIDQDLALSGRSSPTQLSANTNNWAPVSLSTSSVIRVSTDASRDLTGITGGADGRILILVNVGTNNLVLKNEDTNSTAANRFSFGSNRTLAGGDGLLLWYDTVSSRWRGIDILSSGGAGGGTTNFAYAGGRLTLSTGVKVLGAAVTGATSVFYTPDMGGQIGLYDGVGAWSLVTFAEKSVKLTDIQTCTLATTGNQITVPDASQLVAGMKVSGTGIPANTTIATWDNDTHVTLNNTPTITGTSSVTFKCPADTGYDVFGRNVTGALKLFIKKRASILTPNTMTTQDGVDVLSGDTTLRWLGAVITSATDGQADWALSGQRRFRLWNKDNRRFRNHCESFATSGTWYRPLGIVSATADVRAPGGGAGGQGSAASAMDGTAGGTTSFGSHVSATGGAGGARSVATGTPTDGADGASGAGSGGDTNLTGGGYPGGLYITNGSYRSGRGGSGGRAILTLTAVDLGATETVTIGSKGIGGTGNTRTGLDAERDGSIEVPELVEF